MADHAQYSLFDSHCHFDFSAFDTDRQVVMERAFKLQVAHIMVPGVSPAQWVSAALVAEKLNANKFTKVHLALGLHPWWFKSWFENASHENGDGANRLKDLHNELLAVSKLREYKAIGETGLDTLMSGEQVMEVDYQLAIVTTHFNVANELQLPVILHCRKAHNPLIELLNEMPIKAGGVLHGFSGSYELAQQYYERGILIGVGGTITYPRAHKTREAVKKLPKDALVLETDAPDMPLFGRQGERNSPEYLLDIAKEMASLRGESLADVCDYSFKNACKLFAI